MKHFLKHFQFSSLIILLLLSLISCEKDDSSNDDECSTIRLDDVENKYGSVNFDQSERIIIGNAISLGSFNDSLRPNKSPESIHYNQQYLLVDSSNSANYVFIGIDWDNSSTLFIPSGTYSISNLGPNKLNVTVAASINDKYYIESFESPTQGNIVVINQPNFSLGGRVYLPLDVTISISKLVEITSGETLNFTGAMKFRPIL